VDAPEAVLAPVRVRGLKAGGVEELLASATAHKTLMRTYL